MLLVSSLLPLRQFLFPSLLKVYLPLVSHSMPFSYLSKHAALSRFLSLRFLRLCPFDLSRLHLLPTVRHLLAF
jgi:hypothetical protein